MEETFELLDRYKYPALFAFVFAEQIGLPLPALPILLAAGALVRTGQLDLALALPLAVSASVVSDVVWYELGRLKGTKVLQLLCKISLEPDSCVRRTEELFARYGARSLVLAKFVPGYNTVAPPLAGIFGLRRRLFLLYDGLGALLWLGAFGSLGYIFADQLGRLLEEALRMGSWLGGFVLGALALYILAKYRDRRRFLRELRLSRITPEELRRRLDAREDLVVVDLRHAMEFEAAPETVPGAWHVPVEEIEQRHGDLPREQEVVLLCT